jgi:hypothetical protein
MNNTVKAVAKVVTAGVGAALIPATAGMSLTVVLLTGLVSAAGSVLTLQNDPVKRRKQTGVKGGAKGQEVDDETPRDFPRKPGAV